MQTMTFEAMLEEYRRLSELLRSGQIPRRQFLMAAQQLEGRDQRGGVWRISPRDGVLLRFDGREWVPGTPPPPAAAPVPRSSGSGRGKKARGGATCIALMVVGLIVIVCLCAVGAGVYYWMPVTRYTQVVDLNATTNAIYATQLAEATALYTSPDPDSKTATPVPQVEIGEQPPVEAGSVDQTWLVMLYQDADDEVLERDIFIDFNEAEVAGSSGQVQIVSQIDRYQGAYTGDGNWTSTRRYYLTQDHDLENIYSQELFDIGEANMGDGETLVDFALWAIESYPADRYVLILSDHGSGWLGGWSDSDPYEDEMLLDELETALGVIVQQSGIGQFELIGFDACLMAQLEVFSAVAPYARYAVASEEIEPALGWAYAGFLSQLTANPGMSGAELARAIVESYIHQDQRIVDEQARKLFVEELFLPQGSSADEVAGVMSVDVTLSAVDLSMIPALNQALNELAVVLPGINQSVVSQARMYAQSFESVFGDDLPASYIDLGHFALLLNTFVENDAGVQAAAAKVQQAVQQAVIAEMHGPEKPGAMGVSIFFPNSELFAYTFDPVYEFYLYPVIASRFAAESLWDNYLTFHYTGESFSTDPGVEVTVQPDLAVVAPGAGGVSIAPVWASAEVIGLDDVVTLTTEVSGDNIAYIYFYVSYYMESDGSYLAADMDYVVADDTREIGGVYYPDWGDGGVVTIEFDWEPTVFYLSDGVTADFALFYPVDYGAPGEESVYAVDGMYTFAGSGERRNATMYFGSSGDMRTVTVFSGEGGSGAPHEVTPQLGDQFTVIEEYVEYDQNGEGFYAEYEGATFTFSGENFFFEAYYAYTGDYVIGFIVEDLDGNFVEESVFITVVE